MKTGLRVATKIVAGLAAVAALSPLSGCGTGGGVAASGSITVYNGATGNMVENFNPFMPGTALQPTLGVIYETLMWQNAANGGTSSEPKQMLATGYKWNADGSQLTITTRPNVKWSDGKPFTAKDVAFTINLQHDTPAINTSGAGATAKAADDTHVTLTFYKHAERGNKGPIVKGTKSYMQLDNVLYQTPIVPEHIWKNMKNITTNVNKNPVGTGPFKLQSFSPQSYVLTANADYWGGAPKLKTVRYISLNDANGTINALLAGKVDWMSSFIPGIDDMLKKNPNVKYVNTPALTTVAVTCSNASLGCKGPQTDVAVRQAINLAMDRTQLIKLAGAGKGGAPSPTMLLTPRDNEWIADSSLQKSPMSPDQKAAGDILDKAGWKMGPNGYRVKDGKELDLTIATVSGWSDYINIMATLQQELKPVGIKLTPQQLTWNNWNQNQLTGNFELSLDSLGLGASTDPYWTYSPRYDSINTVPAGKTLQSSGNNTSRYANSDVDGWIEDAANAATKADKVAAYSKIQKQIASDLPYIPIYVNSMETEFYTKNVTGFPTMDNLYALPAAWKGYDNGIILQRLSPKK